jgi:hypothetical protein
MKAVVCQLSDEIYELLSEQACEHGCSIEGEASKAIARLLSSKFGSKNVLSLSDSRDEQVILEADCNLEEDGSLECKRNNHSLEFMFGL